MKVEFLWAERTLRRDRESFPGKNIFNGLLKVLIVVPSWVAALLDGCHDLKTEHWQLCMGPPVPLCELFMLLCVWWVWKQQGFNSCLYLTYCPFPVRRFSLPMIKMLASPWHCQVVLPQATRISSRKQECQVKKDYSRYHSQVQTQGRSGLIK